jgi:hypothetical protein
MSELVVTRALPNPAGKDRTAGRATNEQLNNEWAEFANTAVQPRDLEGVALSHYTFSPICARTGEDRLMSFTGTLKPGHSVRVHTGSGEAWTEGTIRHLYAGRGNYAWNNSCGDTAVLRSRAGDVLDYASYDPQPPEGRVLNRIPATPKLSATAATRIA